MNVRSQYQNIFKPLTYKPTSNYFRQLLWCVNRPIHVIILLNTNVTLQTLTTTPAYSQSQKVHLHRGHPYELPEYCTNLHKKSFIIQSLYVYI